MGSTADILIELKEVSVKSDHGFILENVSFTIRKNEAWAITGPSGGGKTSLGKLLAGLLPIHSGSLKFNLPDGAKTVFISQQHDFRYLSSGRAYYQQRFDNNYSSDSLQVEEVWQRAHKENNSSEDQIRKIKKELHITHLDKRRTIELSNGEGKRLQLALALLKDPAVLILDNPFIGLDVETRKVLHKIMNRLHEKGMLLIIITSIEEIPACISNVIELQSGKLIYAGAQKGYKLQANGSFKKHAIDPEMLTQLQTQQTNDFSVAVEMKNVNVSFGGKKILDGINWRILKGERWALTGHNGAGKSTVLSLITADNPQAYLNDIVLFDKKRGSGESIWEIKSKMGYISPELHLFFQRNITYTESVSISSGSNDLAGFSLPRTSCFEAVASGFNEQIGSSQEITRMQSKTVERWMELLGIPDLKKENLYQVSLGKQRLVLLARALVKNPPMLILDEPCQGLDVEQRENFKEIVDTICYEFNKTMIYVSHYPDDIPGCVTKFLVLENGRVK